MPTIARTDTSLFGQWWWTVDRWALTLVVALIGIGAILVAAASPPVAARINLDEFHFVQRHLVYTILASGVLVGTSLLGPTGIRRLALSVLIVGLIMLVLTPIVGAEIKGARRWIQLPGISFQPSEFVKPAFIVIAAWLFTLGKVHPRFPGAAASTALFLTILGLLVLQPDMGMAVVVTAVWGIQFFLAGLPMPAVLVLGAIAAGGMISAYYLLPHVASRVDRFLDPSSGDSYQIGRSLEAFTNGGIFGAGPGEGRVKTTLPDAHADFIFAVAGEEFGLIWCLILLSLFAVLVVRGFVRLASENSLFIILATSGLLVQFGLQSLINMGSSLHLIPTKGMTLPLISYGGSSMVAVTFGLGMVLGLTRRRPGQDSGWTGGMP
ncbi:putative lipid II flippase FtsW [Fodinicurvata sp. EGI_FJ10296]|jgi:cell division protein FtsW|uniref:putative lipid II flippase FtsW n=1 Tax=Fodinicurvata sp. EGI_FJ10296 TaxID=3231908 RepID=UPI0034551706